MAVVPDAGAGLRAAAHASVIQLRAPGLSTRELEREARDLVAASPVPVLVSSRCDVALASGAAGVNLPERDVPVASARRLLGGALVGRSVHSLEAAVEAAVSSLKAGSRETETKEQIAQVASISAADNEIGGLISEAIDKVGKDGVITVEESQTFGMDLELVEGMRFDKGYISPYFVTDPERMEAVLEDSYLLLVGSKISAVRDLLPVLEKVMQTGKPLAIIAEDVDGEALDAIYRDAMTMDDYLSARPITTPFGLYDCDVPCDASIAVIVRLAEGAADEALRVARQALPHAIEALGPSNEAVRMAWPAALTAALQLGRLDAAHDLIALLDQQPAGHIPPYLNAQLARGRGLVNAAEERHDNVEEELARALTGFGELGYPYWLAVAQTDLAEWLIGQDHGSEATALLEEAVEMLESLEAAPALARARDLAAVTAATVA